MTSHRSLPLLALVLGLCLIGLGHHAQAQYLSPLVTPKASNDAPSWTSYLYAKPLNMYALDSAYDAYYRSHPKSKSVWVRYYKRLRRLMSPFVQADGTVQQLLPSEMLAKAAKQRTNHISSAVQWQPIGPFQTLDAYTAGKQKPMLPWQSNVYAFDISAGNPNVLYAVGETGGFFKSTNKGKAWTQLDPGIYSNSEAVAIDPTNENIVYVGVSGGVVKTTDGGATWTSVWNLNNLYVFDLEVHTTQPRNVYAATSLGFYRSSDNGAHWVQEIDRSCCDMETQTNNHNVIFTLRENAAQTAYEFWKSTDGGQNFSIRSDGWLSTSGSSGGGRLTVSPADPNRVYAVLLGDSAKPYILRSDDAGEHWRISAVGKSDSLAMNNGQGYYDLSIAASHVDANLLMIGTQTAYRSTDGGQTFHTAIGGYTGTFAIHPDIQEMKCMGSDCYIATDGGFNYSNDLFGSNWESRTIGINGSDFWGFDAGWNEDVLVGGRYHNGNTAWAEGYGTKYMRLGGGEAATGYVNPIMARHTYFSDIGGYDLPASDSGTPSNFSAGMFPNESYYHMEFSEMRWDPRCYGTVWIGKDNALYRSTNNGRSYDKMWESTDDGAVLQHIEISRRNPAVMYVSQRSNTLYDGKIWRSSDEGKTWTALPPFPGTTGGQRRVMKISLSSSDPNTLFVALLNGDATHKVFKTTNGGENWTNLTTASMTDYGITDIMAQYGTKDGVYLASYFGHVYYRNAQMDDWVQYGDGLPYALFSRDIKPFYRDNKLRVGTSMGIWEAPLYEHSQPQAMPTVDKRTTACERDTFYFDDYSVLERANAQWQWSFPGAAWVSDSTARNPKVLYAHPGSYAVTLRVRNDYGSDSMTIANMVQVQTSVCNVDTVAGRALDLGATNDLASISAIPSLSSALGFTVSCWIKLDTIQRSFSQILSNWPSDVGFSLGFAFEGYRPNTNLTFYWKNVPYQLTSPFDLPLHEWVHIACTVDTSSVTLYVNGVPWRYTNASADFKHYNLGATPWEIGGGLPGQGGNFQGQIDELTMYRRTLDSNEIRSRMHRLRVPEITPDSIAFPEPVAYFQFNEQDPSRFYSRYGTATADNAGGTSVVSTAPIGVGWCEWHELNTGSTTFSLGSELSRSQGDKRLVYLTRLSGNPDSVLGTWKHRSPLLWIVHAYPAGLPLSLDSLALGWVGDLSAADAAQPSLFKLYKRPVNEYRNNWYLQSQGQSADSATQHVWFRADSSAEGQYILVSDGNSPLGVDDQSPSSQDNAFSLQPQPARDELIVQWFNHGSAELRILDLSGREYKRLRIDQARRVIDISALASGLYTVELQDDHGVHRKSMIIAR